MYSLYSRCIFGIACFLAFSCGEQKGLEPNSVGNNGPVVRMWDEADDEMIQIGSESDFADKELSQASEEMTQAGSEMNPSATGMMPADTEMLSAGTEMISAGTEIDANTLEYITINEIVAHDTDDQPDWIEFANQSDQDVDLRGWVIEDASQNTIMFAPDTIVPANGYLRLVQGIDFMFDLPLRFASDWLSC